MIVIDVGCANHNGEASIPHLLTRFDPSVLYGFDPACLSASRMVGGAMVNVQQAAAWTEDGTVGFRVAGTTGRVEEENRTLYRCVDLARFILALPDDDIVLKMDAEGAEYTLLPYLVQHDADLRLTLGIIEWHCLECGLGGNGKHREGCKANSDEWWERRHTIERDLRCPTEEWGY